jgi:NADH-quinone oxidoreductase subunit E
VIRVLSALLREQIALQLRRYPDRRSACVDALRIVQRERGWVSDEALVELAELLEMSPAELDGVATFYSQIFRRPVGRHVLLLCDSVSCWILGAARIRARLSELGIQEGKTSEGGLYTLLPTPCLGACDRAPVMMVDDRLEVDLDASRLEERLGPRG